MALGKIIKGLKSEKAQKILGGSLAAGTLGGTGYMAVKSKKALEKIYKDVKEEEARQKKAKNKKKGMKAGGVIKAMKKIKGAAGPVALTGAFGGAIGSNIYAAKNNYGLISEKEMSVSKNLAAKNKNKKKNTKAGSIVDRQYLKGR